MLSGEGHAVNKKIASKNYKNSIKNNVIKIVEARLHFTSTTEWFLWVKVGAMTPTHMLDLGLSCYGDPSEPGSNDFY